VYDGFFPSLRLWSPLQACPDRNVCDFEKITLTESKSNAIPQKKSASKVNFTVFKVILTLLRHFFALVKKYNVQN